ncbi:MAG: aldehyde ferredoxin oxidoreductase family protein [Bacteroidales bacterium]|jgi:aldehyde:ferredoxin oxidoreductase|nr:aldehyde ferredoxin oxidoreductase family protein [Bacteroidales bacterium]
MMTLKGYYGKLLDINLTTGEIKKIHIPEQDIKHFLGGRGLGTKILWDKLPEPGIDPLSPENPLLFMPGPFSGLPIPSSSRTCVVTKSPRTSAIDPLYEHGSTVSYSNMGGFFGPEIRYAGYDGICITGKAERPVYIKITDEEVEICDATKFWGMGTDDFDKAFTDELGNRKYESCYIGPAGEKLVPMACIINTAARAAGRGGTGCIMGSKNLKAVAVKGTQMPNLGDHKEYLDLLSKIRKSFKENNKGVERWRYGGTTDALESSSKSGTQAVKNYSEGTFAHIREIGTEANRKKVWKRDFACFSCHLACKKSGLAKGAYGVMVHDGPEYETGTMLGANLLISDLSGLHKLITVGDEYGIDIISAGNTIGFLMEAYEKKLIDTEFLDGIELTWGNVDAALEMMHKMSNREGVGEMACHGVKYLAGKIGGDAHKFAIHVKGHELAAWNVPVNSDYWSITYSTCNRGACHMNGGSPERQDQAALRDSIAACSFASSWYRDEVGYARFLGAITGIEWTDDDFAQAGTRIFTLEKMFNYREGFRRKDDRLPEKFFENKFTFGDHQGAIVDRNVFENDLTNYYNERKWDPTTSKPNDETLRELNLEFTI